MNPLQGIKNVIFDFGGVLIDLDRERCIRSFEKLGINARGLLGQYVQSGIFSKIETGTATSAEFVEAMRKAAGSDGVTETQIVNAWNDFLVGIPADRLDCLAAIKDKYHLFLLSNTNELHWTYSEKKDFTYKQRDVDFYFEKKFLSYEMGLAKPDCEIFRAAVRAAGVNPAETLFVDDSKDNCMAAESIGLHTFNSVSGGDWMKLFE